MSEELQQKLRDQLWEVANKLRGNMSASDFMYFTLGFIFYKYLSEKIEAYANNALVDDEVSFKELWTMEDEDAAELQEELKKQCLEGVGYFIEPTYLFSSVIDRIKKKENILPILERSLKRIEDSTLGHDSEEDFGGLFSDIDLASPKLGKTADDKNTLVSNVLLALDDIKFGVEASEEIDILGDAYEYMIGQLYKYYIDHVEKLPEEYGKMLKSGEASVERVVCDFIAGMTDRYAVATYQSLTIPRTWSVL